MADFQVPEDILTKIKTYFSLSHSNEPCGALCIVKGKLRFYPIENHSTVPDTFSLDPVQYTRVIRHVCMIVHGHSNNCIPSEHDIIQSNIHGIPYLIFNLQNYDYDIVWPDAYINLSGKSYKFGVNDCFEAARKWYMIHGLVFDIRKNWEDDWWEKGFDYFKAEISAWGFVPTEHLEYGNLITFSMGSSGIDNHLGIYIDNDEFFHHAANRLSCRENLYPTWGEHITGIYKYENSNFRGFSRRQIW
jgi:proteasome lid subunit RPN8/RPN11